MDNKKLSEIRAADRKHGKKFALIMVCSLALGLVLGLGSIALMGLDREKLDYVSGCLVPIGADLLLWAGLLLSTPLALRALRQAERLPLEEAAENDQEADRLITRAITLVTANLILTYTTFGMAASLLGAIRREEYLPSREVFLLVLVTSVLGLFLSLVQMMILQRRAVNLTKLRNPEKEGSVFQMDFSRTWLQSCDEAEKALVYEAAFQAYRVGTYACLGLWCLSLIAAVVGWTGWFTLLVVGLIWAALQGSYCWFCWKRTAGSSLSAGSNLAG